MTDSPMGLSKVTLGQSCPTPLWEQGVLHCHELNCDYSWAANSLHIAPLLPDYSLCAFLGSKTKSAQTRKLLSTTSKSIPHNQGCMFPLLSHGYSQCGKTSGNKNLGTMPFPGTLLGIWRCPLTPKTKVSSHRYRLTGSRGGRRERRGHRGSVKEKLLNIGLRAHNINTSICRCGIVDVMTTWGTMFSLHGHAFHTQEDCCYRHSHRLGKGIKS